MRTHQMEPFSCQPYCDLGAQYLTVGQDSPIGMDYVQSIYSLLQSNSILTPLFFAPSSSGDQGEGSTKVKHIDGMKPDHLSKQHFIAPKGTASIVSFLASYHQPQKQSYSVASSTRYNTKMLKLSIEGSRVRVTGGSTSAGITEPELNEELFDVVVLTVPASQLLQMDAPHLLDRKLSSEETLRQRLQQVRYSSRLNSIAFSLALRQSYSLFFVKRYAMAAYYDLGSLSALEELLASIPWRAKYVFDDDIVRYISIENYKFKGSILAA